MIFSHYFPLQIPTVRESLLQYTGPAIATTTSVSAQVPLNTLFYGENWLSGNVMQVPLTGTYQIIAYARWVQSTTNSRLLRLLRNGSTIMFHAFRATNGGFSGGIIDQGDTQAIFFPQLTANDLIRLDVEQNSGGALNLATTERKPFLYARFLG